MRPRRKYYHVEKWRIGTIARQLHVHYDTVARVLAQAGLPRHGQPPRPSKADPYLPFIRQTLETFPTLTASRLHAMVCERGYAGSPGHFRSIVARLRPTRLKPICACAPCRESKRKWTGLISEASPSAAPAVR